MPTLQNSSVAARKFRDYVCTLSFAKQLFQLLFTFRMSFTRLWRLPQAPYTVQPYWMVLCLRQGLRDWLSWVMDVTGLIKRLDKTYFFRVRCTSFHNHSSLLTFFLCLIFLFQSCCSHAQVFGKTLVHEFPIFYSHTECNLLSSFTNTLLRWHAFYKTTKLQTKIETEVCTSVNGVRQP